MLGSINDTCIMIQKMSQNITVGVLITISEVRFDLIAQFRNNLTYLLTYCANCQLSRDVSGGVNELSLIVNGDGVTAASAGLYILLVSPTTQPSDAFRHWWRDVTLRMSVFSFQRITNITSLGLTSTESHLNYYCVTFHVKPARPSATVNSRVASLATVHV